MEHICSLPRLSLAAFWIFNFITGFEQSDYDVPWCSFLHVSCAWRLWSFLDLWVIVFFKCEKILAILSSSIFLSLPFFSLSETPVTYTLGHWRLLMSNNSSMILFSLTIFFLSSLFCIVSTVVPST